MLLLVGSQWDLNNTNLSLPVANKEQCEWDFIDWVFSKAAVACLQWWQVVFKTGSIILYWLELNTVFEFK